MRSKASIKGHPIHPALIPFPIAFLIGAFAADVIGVLSGTSSLWMTGAYMALAGIGTALVAAVPGFIDYFYAVPPRSSAKNRATKHMISNLTAVGLFVVAMVLRGSILEAPGTLQLMIEGLGVVALTAGGWMGGTLTYRNQIGVDHRYANAGRWNPVRLREPAETRLIVSLENELEIGQMKLVIVGGRRFVVGRTEEGYVAFDDHCTHRGGPLSDGALICGTVQCPWHGSQFDVYTGEVRAGPARTGITVYHVEHRQGKLWLELEQAEPAARA